MGFDGSSNAGDDAKSALEGREVGVLLDGSPPVRFVHRSEDKT